MERERGWIVHVKHIHIRQLAAGEADALRPRPCFNDAGIASSGVSHLAPKGQDFAPHGHERPATAGILQGGFDHRSTLQYGLELFSHRPAPSLNFAVP
jgi:hypothetical protein